MASLQGQNRQKSRVIGILLGHVEALTYQVPSGTLCNSTRNRLEYGEVEARRVLPELNLSGAKHSSLVPQAQADKKHDTLYFMNANVVSLNDRGIRLLRDGHMIEGIARFTNAIQRAPENPLLWCNRSFGYSALTPPNWDQIIPPIVLPDLLATSYSVCRRIRTVEKVTVATSGQESTGPESPSVGACVTTLRDP